MSKEQYPYPEDEFDTLGAARHPKGVHREPVSTWVQWLPYLLVIVLVPLLTFGAVKYFAPNSTPDPTPTTSPSAPSDEATAGDDAEGNGDADTDEADGDGAEGEGTGGDGAGDPDEPGEGTDDPQGDDPQEPAQVDREANVLVLNGAQIQGLAGQVADALTAQGWTNTQADNYANAAPTVTTLYYTSAQFEAEAQDIAQQLGIDTVIEDALAASNGVVIVLRPDFTLPG